MDRVFSVDEIGREQFWSSVEAAEEEEEEEECWSSASKTINRSSSEWAFQRFLQEASPRSSSSRLANDVVEIKDHTTTTTATGPPVDSEEYQAFLKTRLNLACAAVALTRVSCVKPPDSASLLDKGSHASNTSQLGSEIPPKGSGCNIFKGQDTDAGSPVGLPSSPMQKKYAVQVKSTTSGSSRELSDDDDDELEGETETTQNMNPTDAKRVRR